MGDNGSKDVAPLPDDHPAIKAWTRYSLSDEYVNTFRWARHPDQKHTHGSLWAAFINGWKAAGGKVDA